MRGLGILGKSRRYGIRLRGAGWNLEVQIGQDAGRELKVSGRDRWCVLGRGIRWEPKILIVDRRHSVG